MRPVHRVFHKGGEVGSRRLQPAWVGLKTIEKTPTGNRLKKPNEVNYHAKKKNPFDICIFSFGQH